MMAVFIYAFETLACAGRPDHAGIWPPATGTPKTIRFGSSVADEKVIGGTFDRCALKPGSSIKRNATNAHAAESIRPETIEKAVESLTHPRAIESPVPTTTNI